MGRLYEKAKDWVC